MEGYVVNLGVRAVTWNELLLGTSPYFQDCIHILFKDFFTYK